MDRTPAVVCALAAAGLALACSRSRADAPSALTAIVESPQYLGVRLDGGDFRRSDTPENRARCGWPAGLPFLGNERYCVLISQDLPRLVPDAAARREAMARGLREIRAAALGGAPEVPRRRLAVEVILDVLDVPEADQGMLEAYLDDLLAVSVQERVPVLVNLDTVNWLRGRPDVSADPANAEATFTETAAISWRNWGAQLRVGTPPPNLAAPGFRAAVAAALRRLLPHLSAFYADLAPEERDLFAGLVLGTELSVGVNAYYYAGGNALLPGRPECDPGTPRRADCPGPPPAGPCGAFNQNTCLAGCTADAANGTAEPLGYAAARAMRLLAPGERIGRAALDRIVADYVAFLGRLAREAGVPSHKVIAHVGGVCGPGGPQSLANGRDAGLVPGTSLYLYAADPRALLAGELEASPEVARLPWASPEWLLVAPGRPGADGWADAIEATARYLNNRMVILANWEGVRDDPAAMEGLRRALTAPATPPATVTPVVVVGAAIFRGPAGEPLGTGLAASRLRGPWTIRLLASTRPGLGWDGLLREPDVADEPLPDGASRILSRPAGGTVHVQLVTEGPAGRTTSPVVALEIEAGAGVAAVPWPRLFADVGAGRATFSFDLGPRAGRARLQVSRDPGFATVDGLDQDVTGRALLTTRALRPGVAWHARLALAPAADDPGGPVASNVIAFTVPPP
jgi:hypothetical protein